MFARLEIVATKAAASDHSGPGQAAQGPREFRAENRARKVRAAERADAVRSIRPCSGTSS